MLMAGQCTPRFSFVLPKEKRAVHGPKRKAPGCALVQWPSALKGGGESVPAPIWPCLRARYALLRFPRLPSRGGWCGSCRGARTHLTSFSFRAFRFATRCPGGRGGLHQLPSTAKPAAAKREAPQCDDHPDDLRTIRHGTAVPEIAEDDSVPEGRPKSALAPIRRPPSRGGANAPERV